MWVAVGAALKKIVMSVLTSKNGLKIVGGIVLGLIIVLISPVLVIIALFGGYEKSPPDFLTNNVMDNLDEEQLGQIVLVGDTMTAIETKMIEAGYTEDNIEAANLIYTTTLCYYTTEENFVDRFVACFADYETDEDLINKVNAEFGTAIDVQEFKDILGRTDESETTSSEAITSQTESETGG